jgi:hypothetical protein
VSGTVTVQATAVDDQGVAGVQFRLDGVSLGAEDTTPPYSLPWDSTAASNGSHVLTAVARDSAGNTATSPAVTVIVSNGDVTAPTIVATSPQGGASGVQPSTVVTATFSEAMTASSLNGSTVTLRDGGNVLVPATVAYDPASFRVTLTPSSALAANALYTASIRGGAGGAADASGNLLPADVSWSFTTAALSTCPCTVWPASTVGGPVELDSNAVELGMKFRTDVNGFATGIRFYKHAQNTGTHVGHLWSAAGTLLGTVTFTSETASGWQQANFSKPIPLTANTTYVVSYHTPTGYYAATAPGFTAGIAAPPLRALSDAESGGNGVYRYGASGFPNQTWEASNYWVDIVFTP